MSYAEHIKDSLGLDVELAEAPRAGQFYVQVDGTTVYERKGGLIALLTRRPWADPSEVTAAVRDRARPS